MPRADEPVVMWVNPDGPLARLYREDDLPCRGHGDLFDVDAQHDEEPDQRHNRIAFAIRICRTCSAQDLCNAAFHELPARHRRGVWAGTPHGVGTRTTRAIAQLEDAS